ncbi:MAG: PIN domain-containing protein [Candidatus Micrarchaeota archaeon]
MASLPKIALDTNIVLEQPSRLEELREVFGNKIEIAIPKQVEEELGVLGNRSQKNKKKLAIAKMILKKENVETITVNAKNADDALVALSKEGFAILTMDSRLNQKILRENGSLVEIENKKIKK